MSEGIGVESSKQIPNGLSYVRGYGDGSMDNGDSSKGNCNNRNDGQLR